MYVRAIGQVTVVFKLHSKSDIRGLRKGWENGALRLCGNWKSKRCRVERFGQVAVDLTPTLRSSGASRATIPKK